MKFVSSQRRFNAVPEPGHNICVCGRHLSKSCSSCHGTRTDSLRPMQIQPKPRREGSYSPETRDCQPLPVITKELVAAYTLATVYTILTRELGT